MFADDVHRGMKWPTYYISLSIVSDRSAGNAISVFSICGRNIGGQFEERARGILGYRAMTQTVRPILIKKIKLLIAALRSPPFLSTAFCPSLCFPIFSFSFCLPSPFQAQSKLDPRARTPQRWQAFLMSARLIGRNFINAGSIEIGAEKEYRQSSQTMKNSDAILREFTRVFIKYDDCSLGTTTEGDTLVSDGSIGSLCFATGIAAKTPSLDLQDLQTPSPMLSAVNCNLDLTKPRVSLFPSF